MVEIILPYTKRIPERIIPTYRYTIPSYIYYYPPVPPKVNIPAVVRKRLREYAYAIENIKERYRRALKVHAAMLKKAREYEYKAIKQEEFLPTPPFFDKAIERFKRGIRKVGAGIKAGTMKTLGWAKRAAIKMENAVKESWRKTSAYLTSLYKNAKEGAKRMFALGVGFTRKVGEGIGKVVTGIRRKFGETWNWLVKKGKASRDYLKNLAEKLRKEGRENEARAIEASIEQLTEPSELALQEAASELEEAKQEELKAKRMNWLLPMALVGGITILAVIIMLMKK